MSPRSAFRHVDITATGVRLVHVQIVEKNGLNAMTRNILGIMQEVATEEIFA